MLLTLLINGVKVPMFINMLITWLGIISPTLKNLKHLNLSTQIASSDNRKQMFLDPNLGDRRDGSLYDCLAVLRNALLDKARCTDKKLALKAHILDSIHRKTYGWPLSRSLGGTQPSGGTQFVGRVGVKPFSMQVFQ